MIQINIILRIFSKHLPKSLIDKPQTLYSIIPINQSMKKGAYAGAIIALVVYFLLPIHADDGTPAMIVPTGAAISSTTGFASYLFNLPFSIIIFFALEILGISVGIAAEMILRRYPK